MPESTRLRDSTQIVLRRETLESLECDLDSEFTVTVFRENEEFYRIIGSPSRSKPQASSSRGGR